MHYTGCCFLSKMSITLFEHDFKGKQLTLRQSAPDLRKENFNDKASSVEVSAGFWRLWEHINYAGRFWIVGPGRYGFSELSEKIGNDCISSVEKLPTIQLYEHADFKGKELTLHDSTPDLRKLDFNDKASSVVVSEGQWKLWEHINYTGKFFVVGPGRYDIAVIREKIGNDVISSVEKLPEMTIKLYEHADFKGRELTLHDSTPDLRKLDFNDKASSVVVSEGQWKLWEHINYTGKFFVVGPGRYDIAVIREKIGNDVISSVEKLPEMTIKLYEHAGFKGRELTLHDSTPDLRQVNDFNDIASSVVVSEGQWKLWEHINYTGRSFVVGPGRYDFAQISAQIGNDVISSVEKLPMVTIKLYEHAGFKGRELTLHDSTPDLRQVNDFNDIASSVEVVDGYWRMCEHIDYKGRNIMVGPGRYDYPVISKTIGNDCISSVEKL